MKIRKYWFLKLYRRAIQFFIRHFFIDKERDTSKSILIAGTARSGTTWLAELISGQIPCRMLFEPFNNNLVDEYRSFHYFQYIRPGDQNKSLYSFAEKVFTGEIRNYWIDRKNENLLPKIRLIKEIRANLLLKWLHNNFPDVPIIFMLRHPCAVVLSRMELGWATDTDIESFFQQPDLINDFLYNYQDVIKDVQTDEEKHAIIWCVTNLIPLQAFQPGVLQLVFYENLCVKPEYELSRILNYIKKENVHLRKIKADMPSTTSSLRSAVVSGENKISRWQNVLSASQICRIQNIVKRFNLDYLYGDSLNPIS